MRHLLIMTELFYFNIFNVFWNVFFTECFNKFILALLVECLHSIKFILYFFLHFYDIRVICVVIIIYFVVWRILDLVSIPMALYIYIYMSMHFLICTIVPSETLSQIPDIVLVSPQSNCFCFQLYFLWFSLWTIEFLK